MQEEQHIIHLKNSEHESIKALASSENINHKIGVIKHANIESSELLNSLSWVYHHGSVIEHASLSYLVKNIGRGVLQELVRHRISSYTVKSSRYTMGSIINAYTASSRAERPRQWFVNKMHQLNILITTERQYNDIEYNTIFDKLGYQELQYKSKDEFIKDTVSKSSIEFLSAIKNADKLYETLENGKAKRNIGDPFKGIVTDNWKTDLVMTINLRSLKNFLQLRDSGSAWFQIQWLAQEIKKQTPLKYLRLIDKEFKDK